MMAAATAEEYPSSTTNAKRGVTDVDNHDDEHDEPEMNPLQVGFWMEGDSLAPPCGTSIPTIHKILKIASIHSEDVLYDLGCGDARVCLEAWIAYGCRTIGIEVEADLVQRAHTLVDRCRNSGDAKMKEKINRRPLPKVYPMDLRAVLDQLVRQASIKYPAESSTLSAVEQNVKDQTCTVDLPLPTVIILYLLPESLKEIQPQLSILLDCLPNNFRIVCNTWGIPNWKAAQESLVEEETSPLGVRTSIYVYNRKSVHQL
jgi:hypothetical protein